MALRELACRSSGEDFSSRSITVTCRRELPVLDGFGLVHAAFASALVSLAVLRGLGGRLGGAPVLRTALRAVGGGGFAVAIMAGIGRPVGLVAVG